MSTHISKISEEDVVFAEANNDQLTTVWELNASAWAAPLSVEDHVLRERTLSQQPGAGESWRTWTLALRSDTSVLVASVETFERRVLVGENNTCRMEKGYGIASVFTNPQYRGNGMAGVLLEKLKQWMDGEGEGWISVLYSDIGESFYNRLGWITSSVKSMQLETDPTLFDQAHNGISLKLPGLKILREDILPDVCMQDSDDISSRLAKVSKDGQVHFAIVPRHELIQWHIKREDLNGSLMHGRWKPRFRGMISESGRAWIIWHFDEPEHKLKVQRIVTLDDNELERNIREVAALIRMAQWVGKGSGFMTLVIWNPDEVTVAAAKLLASHYERMQMAIEERKGSLACMRRRHDELQDALTWDANEYYAWC